MAAESHVVHHSDPELNGVGGDHVSGSRYLMKMKADLNRKYKLNMETTKATGSRVTMGDHMFLCSCGLGMFGPAVAYRG